MARLHQVTRRATVLFCCLWFSCFGFLAIELPRARPAAAVVFETLTADPTAAPGRGTPVHLIQARQSANSNQSNQPNQPNQPSRRSRQDGPAWRHPVVAPIVDFFRPPGGPYGPGNRGLEYGTRPGQSVMAVDGGQVTFAGTVGHDRFVVVSHSPELRSTYAYLQTIDVAVGDVVDQGDVLATAGTGFHLTARVHGVYVDPLGFMAASWSVRLIPSRSGVQ